MNNEHEKIINQFESVKVTRRQALKYLGTAIVAGSICAGNLGILVHDEFKGREVSSDLDKNFPRPPEDSDLQDKYQDLQNQIINLATKGQWEDVEKITKSEEFVKVNSSRIQQEIYQKARGKKGKEMLQEKAIFSKSENWLGLSLLGIFGTELIAGAAALQYLITERKNVERSKEAARKRLSFYERVLKGKPVKEIIAFDSKLHYLPPLGGKIYAVNDAGYNDTIEPTISAEEQSETVKDLRRTGELGEHYIHQLTVQGKLPDQFKFAAIALILHSPFLYDWNQPFFEAEWGKIGPLIHDGGNVNTRLNPLWKKNKGRTDFLQRVSINNASEIDTLEKLSPQELINVPVDKLDKARQDQLEEERIGLEGKFYQRAAACLHAKAETLPNKIPKRIKKELVSVWDNYETNIRTLLIEYNLDGIGEVTWFLDKPTDKGNLSAYGKRYEADWEPIKQELIKFEEIRQKHPEIRPKINKILSETVDSVDRIIGLK